MFASTPFRVPPTSLLPKSLIFFVGVLNFLLTLIHLSFLIIILTPIALFKIFSSFIAMILKIQPSQLFTLMIFSKTLFFLKLLLNPLLLLKPFSIFLSILKPLLSLFHFKVTQRYLSLIFPIQTFSNIFKSNILSKNFFLFFSQF